MVFPLPSPSKWFAPFPHHLACLLSPQYCPLCLPSYLLVSPCQLPQSPESPPRPYHQPLPPVLHVISRVLSASLVVMCLCLVLLASGILLPGLCVVSQSSLSPQSLLWLSPGFSFVIFQSSLGWSGLSSRSHAIAQLEPAPLSPLLSLAMHS